MNPFKYLVRLNDWREGDRRLWYLERIGNLLTGDAQQLQRYQLERLRHIVSTGYSNTEFYRERLDRAGVHPGDLHSIDDLARVPVLEKDDIRKNQKGMLNSRLDPRDMVATATGGTTSSPVPFYVDRESWAQKRAATLFFFGWFNYEVGVKTAYLWGAEQDFASTRSLKRGMRNFLIDKSLYLPTSYLNQGILSDYYRRMLKFGPKVLQAYPTPLYLFADFLTKNGLRLDLENVNVSAEYLYDYQRDAIEQAFGRKIFNWYGARELGHIATECHQHRGMHLNASGVYLEVIKDGKSVWDQEGDIVVTDLLNEAMPLIRYRIGDMGTLSTRVCPCGSALPILESVGGRYVDTFKKKDGSVVPGVAFTNRIIKQCSGIRELQIIQKDYAFFCLNVVKGEKFCEADIVDIERGISAFMHDDIDFEISFVDKIPAEKSGKIRFCKSEIAQVPSENR